MTIKRRLFISNLLMIVIPLIAYLAFTSGASIVFLKKYKDAALPMLPEVYFETAFADYIPQVTALWLGMFTVMAIIVFITGRVLARAMTKNIITPLDALVYGVTQIRD
jgi:hypothetical protein